MSKPIRVAIIGTGNIGTDLCHRLLRDSRFEIMAFVGRRKDSPGLREMSGLIPNCIDSGVEGMGNIWNSIDGIFDATSAFDHLDHWSLAEAHGVWAIDLTPSKIGVPIVPVLIGLHSSFELSRRKIANYSMVTCGGQSSAPLTYALVQGSQGAVEIEVSSSIASLSAGPATRRNLDQYIDSTENLTALIGNGIPGKALLVVNPAEPPVMMRTTVSVRAEKFDLKIIEQTLSKLVAQVQEYVPGYDLVIEPYKLTENVVSATAKVTGAGYHLPEYSGNLDIINAAAVETAYLHHVKYGGRE